MPYCPKCGVEVEYYRKDCPLCSFPIPEIPDPLKDDQQRENYLLNRYRIKQAKNRKLWKESRLFVYTGIVAALLVLSMVFGVQDFLLSGGLSWSRTVITCNITAIVSLFFLFGFIPVFLPNFIGLGLTSLGFLYLLDLYNGGVTWFWDLGLVICINTMVWSLILRLAIRHSRRRGLNIAAYFLFASALACLSLEFIHNLYGEVFLRLTWSVTVASFLIPVGGLLLFFYFLLSTRVQERFKRKFHL